MADDLNPLLSRNSHKFTTRFHVLLEKMTWIPSFLTWTEEITISSIKYWTISMNHVVIAPINNTKEHTYTKSVLRVCDPLVIALNSTPSRSTSSGNRHSMTFPITNSVSTVTIYCKNYHDLQNTSPLRTKMKRSTKHWIAAYTLHQVS